MLGLQLILSTLLVLLTFFLLKKNQRIHRLEQKKSKLDKELNLFKDIESLLDNSQEMLGVINSNGDFVYMNISLANTIGINATDEVKYDIFNLFNTENSRNSVEKWLNGALIKGSVHVQSEMITMEQTQLLSVDIRVFALTPQVQDSYMGVAIRDITAEVHNIQEREKHEKQLESLVQQRTHELAEMNKQVLKELNERRYLESRLAKTQKLEAMGQLSAGIAHEINNPINFVNMNIDALGLYVEEIFDSCESQTLTEQRVEYLREDTKELIQESKAGLNKISEIVRGLRSFAQPESGERAPVDIKAMLEESLLMVKGQMKRHQLKCEWGETPPVWGSAVQLSQVFVNIFLNALAAMEKSGILSITTNFHENKAVIQVKDTGVGINEDMGNKLFEPFYTTKGVGEGTGLGLYISYGIIKEHGGEMTYWKRVGPGTTFRIALPVDLRATHRS